MFDYFSKQELSKLSAEELSYMMGNAIQRLRYGVIRDIQHFCQNAQLEKLPEESLTELAEAAIEALDYQDINRSDCGYPLTYFCAFAPLEKLSGDGLEELAKGVIKALDKKHPMLGAWENPIKLFCEKAPLEKLSGDTLNRIAQHTTQMMNKKNQTGGDLAGDSFYEFCAKAPLNKLDKNILKELVECAVNALDKKDTIGRNWITPLYVICDKAPIRKLSDDTLVKLAEGAVKSLEHKNYNGEVWSEPLAALMRRAFDKPAARPVLIEGVIQSLTVKNRDGSVTNPSLLATAFDKWGLSAQEKTALTRAAVAALQTTDQTGAPLTAPLLTLLQKFPTQRLLPPEAKKAIAGIDVEALNLPADQAKRLQKGVEIANRSLPQTLSAQAPLDINRSVTELSSAREAALYAEQEASGSQPALSPTSLDIKRSAAELEKVRNITLHVEQMKTDSAMTQELPAEAPDVKTEIAGKNFDLRNPAELTLAMKHLIEYNTNGYKEAVLVEENIIDHRFKEELKRVSKKYEQYIAKKAQLESAGKTLSTLQKGELNLLNFDLQELEENIKLKAKYTRPSLVERIFEAESCIPVDAGAQLAPDIPANAALQSCRIAREKREAAEKIPTPFQVLTKLAEAMTVQGIVADVTDPGAMRDLLTMAMQKAWNENVTLAEAPDVKTEIAGEKFDLRNPEDLNRAIDHFFKECKQEVGKYNQYITKKEGLETCGEILSDVQKDSLTRLTVDTERQEQILKHYQSLWHELQKLKKISSPTTGHEPAPADTLQVATVAVQAPDVKTEIAGESFDLHDSAELTLAMKHLIDYARSGYKKAVLVAENKIDHHFKEEYNQKMDDYKKVLAKKSELKKAGETLSDIQNGALDLDIIEQRQRLSELKENIELKTKYTRPSLVERALQTADFLATRALPMASAAIFPSPYAVVGAVSAHPRGPETVFKKAAEQARVKRLVKGFQDLPEEDAQEQLAKAAPTAAEIPANAALESYEIATAKREATQKIPAPFQELTKLTEAMTAQGMAGVTDDKAMRDCLTMALQSALNPKLALAEPAEFLVTLPQIMEKKAEPAVTLLEKMPESAFKPDAAVSGDWLNGLVETLCDTIQLGFPNVAGSLLKPVLEKLDPQVFGESSFRESLNDIISANLAVAGGRVVHSDFLDHSEKARRSIVRQKNRMQPTELLLEALRAGKLKEVSTYKLSKVRLVNPATDHLPKIMDRALQDVSDRKKSVANPYSLLKHMFSLATRSQENCKHITGKPVFCGQDNDILVTLAELTECVAPEEPAALLGEILPLYKAEDFSDRGAQAEATPFLLAALTQENKEIVLAAIPDDCEFKQIVTECNGNPEAVKTALNRPRQQAIVTNLADARARATAERLPSPPLSPRSAGTNFSVR